MLQDKTEGTRLCGQALLDRLVSEGFKEIGKHGNIVVFSDGKREHYYNPVSGEIVCSTSAYKRERRLD